MNIQEKLTLFFSQLFPDKLTGDRFQNIYFNFLIKDVFRNDYISFWTGNKIHEKQLLVKFFEELIGKENVVSFTKPEEIKEFAKTRDVMKETYFVCDVQKGFSFTKFKKIYLPIKPVLNWSFIFLINGKIPKTFKYTEFNVLQYEFSQPIDEMFDDENLMKAMANQFHTVLFYKMLLNSKNV